MPLSGRVTMPMSPLPFKSLPPAAVHLGRQSSALSAAAVPRRYAAPGEALGAPVQPVRPPCEKALVCRAAYRRPGVQPRRRPLAYVDVDLVRRLKEGSRP